MSEWIFRREQGCRAWLGREALASAENPAPATKAICPKGMRCFQNELHHVRILNEKRHKWENEIKSVKSNLHVVCESPKGRQSREAPILREIMNPEAEPQSAKEYGT